MSRVLASALGPLQNYAPIHTPTYPFLPSQDVFGIFMCEDLDNGDSFLKLDYSIDCNGEDQTSAVQFAMLMILVYPIGVPAFYGYLMHLNSKELHHLRRKELRLESEHLIERLSKANHHVDISKQLKAAKAEKLRKKKNMREAHRIHHRATQKLKHGKIKETEFHEEVARMKEAKGIKTSEAEDGISADEQVHEEAREILPHYILGLIEPYTLVAYWFELFECFRKVLLVGLPVFFFQGSVEQLLIGQLIAVGTYGIYLYVKPLTDPMDNLLQTAAQVQIYMTLLTSIVLRVNPSDRARDSVDMILMGSAMMTAGMLFFEEMAPGVMMVAEDAAEGAAFIKERSSRMLSRRSSRGSKNMTEDAEKDGEAAEEAEEAEEVEEAEKTDIEKSELHIGMLGNKPGQEQPDKNKELEKGLEQNDEGGLLSMLASHTPRDQPGGTGISTGGIQLEEAPPAPDAPEEVGPGLMELDSMTRFLEKKRMVREMEKRVAEMNKRLLQLQTEFPEAAAKLDPALLATAKVKSASSARKAGVSSPTAAGAGARPKAIAEQSTTSSTSPRPLAIGKSFAQREKISI